MIIISEIPFNLCIAVLVLDSTRNHPIMKEYEEQFLYILIFELI